jgi:uncharacterized membrane protein YdjX (TVP38/TMEM64 family)
MPGGGAGQETIRAIIVCAAALLLLGGGAALIWYGLAAEGIAIADLSEADVERFVRAWGAWSGIGAVALMVLHSFLPLPAEIVPIANGMMFGPWLGIALTWIGAMLGAVLSFALARAFGTPFVRLVLGADGAAQIDRVSPGPGTLLLLRLIPVISFNLINYAAGLMRVPWWTFLWTTALGILPLTIAMVLAGDMLLALPLWSWLIFALILIALWLWLRRRPALLRDPG